MEMQLVVAMAIHTMDLQMLDPLPDPVSVVNYCP